MINDKTLVKRTYWMPKDLLIKLQERADKEDMKVSQLIRKALKKYVK